MRTKLLILTFAVALMAVAAGCSGKKPLADMPQTAAPTPPPPPPPMAPAPAPARPTSSEEEWFRSASLEQLQARLSDIYFDYDSEHLGPEARSVIESNASWLRQPFNTLVIELEGHCDERGTVEYNLALGDRRAVSTASFLTSLGIARDRVRTVSYGKERPICNTAQESCWGKNRRAHFRVASKG